MSEYPKLDLSAIRSRLDDVTDSPFASGLELDAPGLKPISFEITGKATFGVPFHYPAMTIQSSADDPFGPDTKTVRFTFKSYGIKRRHSRTLHRQRCKTETYWSRGKVTHSWEDE